MVVIQMKFCKTEFELKRVGAGMRRFVILGLVVGLTSCAVVGVTTVMVSTAAKVATVPVKVIGAAVKVVTPDDDKSDDTGEN
jgi:flagellar basal body-associated protein FliL